jgi:hypothetical protein
LTIIFNYGTLTSKESKMPLTQDLEKNIDVPHAVLEAALASSDHDIEHNNIYNAEDVFEELLAKYKGMAQLRGAA